MAHARRSWWGWLHAWVAACGLMVANLASAQVVGQVYEGALPTDQGYEVPLPEARWRVTQTADRPHAGVTMRVVALRNEAPQAQLPYLFVRYALQPTSWSSPCDRSSDHAFDISRHWTLPNQLLNRCSRKFVATLPSAASAGWWEA
jgi:hypothetical protein